MEQFFMVLAANSNVTNVRHPTFTAAETEARRLAANNPGIKFYVLGSMGHAVRQHPVSFEMHKAVDGRDVDQIPF